MDSKPKASILKTKLNQRELFHVNLKVILIWHHRWYPISDNRTLRCSKSLYEALYWRVTLKHCSAAILSFQNFYWGGMDGTGVRVLTSHHCGPGLIPGSGVYCCTCPCSKEKNNFPNSNFTWKQRKRSATLVEYLLHNLHYYYHYYSKSTLFCCRNADAAISALHKPSVSIADSEMLRWINNEWVFSFFMHW